jgi:L-amino acid N-acyltransferase YncA
VGIVIRTATAADLPGIVDIANDVILHSTAIWTDRPTDLAWRTRWLDNHVERNEPVLVAADDADQVVAFGSYGLFRAFDGFATTVEHSLHVAATARRGGIGTMMLTALIERARNSGKHVVIGAISSDNAASLALHHSQGFTETGRLPEVGRKFGRWLDLVFMQKQL